MNWKTLSILSSVALAVASPTVANAQRGGHGMGGGHGATGGGRATMGGGGARTGTMASRPTGGAHLGGRTAASNRTAGNINRNSGNVNRNGDRNRRDRGDRWHHRNNNYYYYGGFGYPYYGYGFGSPFGYGGFGYPYYSGFGYGYPYYGGVSATFYSNGYGSSGYGYGSRQQTNQSGNGSVNARVQQGLARAGYYHGSIDGVVGNGTRSAIRAYERANGLQVDGRIDSQLLGRLGVS